MKEDQDKNSLSRIGRGDEGNIIPIEVFRRDRKTQSRIDIVEKLYRDHWTDLCRRLRGVYGNGPPEPEDLAQNAFTKFIDRVDPAKLKNPATFLFRIAVNAGRDRIRHYNQTKRLINEQLKPLGDGFVEQNTPSNVYEAKERLSVTMKAMKDLSPKQQEILFRSRIKGETFEEIKQAKGWSKADISRSLKSALSILQTSMRAYDDDEKNK
ncbi:MAG: sigma-70 family RNA polymerase sigma factor [Emcibacter sp.]|nr:sigma-70 family RNA polymerase sigma factor [Emcibacter sp.]